MKLVKVKELTAAQKLKLRANLANIDYYQIHDALVREFFESNAVSCHYRIFRTLTSLYEYSRYHRSHTLDIQLQCYSYDVAVARMNNTYKRDRYIVVVRNNIKRYKTKEDLLNELINFFSVKVDALTDDQLQYAVNLVYNYDVYNAVYQSLIRDLF